jgi:hypothetical protein
MTKIFEEVKHISKQRFPSLWLGRVLELERAKPIRTLKNVAGHEKQFLWTLSLARKFVGGVILIQPRLSPQP